MATRKTFEVAQAELVHQERRLKRIIEQVEAAKVLRNKLCPHTEKIKQSFGSQTWLKCVVCERNFDAPHQF